MSDLPALDRLGNVLEVGDVVTFAYSDQLHGGTVAYIAPSKIAEIAIEHKDLGLVVRGGEADSRHVIYNDILKRT